jgi:hypothetical protein
MTLRAARAGSRSERCGERAVGGPLWASCGPRQLIIQVRPGSGGSHTGHRGRNGAPRSPGRSCSWAPPGSLTPHLGRHILARLMDRHAIVSECRQQAAHCRARAETASDERVSALLVSMALIWTKLAEEAEPIQRTKRGVANDDTAGQTQVPPGSASDAMPTLQDAHESAQARSSSWQQVR